MGKEKRVTWLKRFRNMRNFGLGFWLCYTLAIPSATATSYLICPLRLLLIPSLFPSLFLYSLSLLLPTFLVPSSLFPTLHSFFLSHLSQILFFRSSSLLIHLSSHPHRFSTPYLVYSRCFIVSSFFCFSNFWVVTGIGYDDVSHMCAICFGVICGACFLISSFYPLKVSP